MAGDADVRDASSRQRRAGPPTAPSPDQASAADRAPGRPPDQPAARGPLHTRSRILRILIPLAVVALALWVRTAGLGTPDEPLVDERYYVGGARDLLEHGVEPSYVTPEPGRLPAVHPPLGKWLIGLGIAVLGDRPVGWRAAGAVAGTLTVALVYLCGRRLFGEVAATAAAFLVAVEDLSVVQSRAAMLDVFLTLWLVAAFWALLRDRAAQDDVQGTAGRRRWRWRLAAGVLLGCAVATKWSGAYALPVAWLLVLGWAAARRRAAAGGSEGAARLLWATVRAELASVISLLVLVPVGVYVASYAGAFLTGTLNPVTWWEDQVRVLLFHTRLDAAHPYASSAVSWLVVQRPIAYFYEQVPVPTDTGPVDGVAEVLALGHPLVFLAITPAAVWAALTWIRRRDHALGAVLLTAAALWLPWTLQDRPMFIFYMTPVVPFVALLQGAALSRLSHRHPAGAALTVVLLAATLALFWFHWPVLTGQPIPYDQWTTRVSDWNRLPLFHFNWV
jgi:dolichyl-phosphate-mannose-protein mannosyltransferase